MNSKLQELLYELNDLIEAVIETARLREDNSQLIEQMNNRTQLKPDWKDAPVWANWLAQDENGEWWWYEDEPSINDDCWSSAEGHQDYAFVTVDNWQDTLEARPKEGEQ